MWQKDRFLILTKTYPTPSAKLREISCVAGLNSNGEMRRIFPVPFRLMEGQAQFKKWEWIEAQVQKAPGDNRPESHQVRFDSIRATGDVIDTKDGWAERRAILEPHVVPNFVALEAHRQSSGQTLGVIRPSKLIELQITKESQPEWTEAEKIKLFQEGLFDTEEVKRRLPLEKIPYAFHYIYECDGPRGPETHKHKITDWEAGQLYRNCRRLYPDNWEDKFRAKLEGEFAKKDLMFLMGTIHRFPSQWLIVGLFYPPKATLPKPKKISPEAQPGLFD